MRYRFGATLDTDGASFRVWAPAQSRLAVVMDDGLEVAARQEDEGFFSAHVPGARAGRRYWYRLKQGLRPDPASRFQPEGPLGPSQLVDAAAFRWTDEGWRGAGPRHRHVFYEMHIGTFTQEGTWAAATERLHHLADVGVTTLEVMPLAEFAGRFGWGYDGVQLFAPTRLYGQPDDVRRFVNEAHRLGLAVILDVVYNHFGPVGNVFPEFSQTVHGAPGEWGDTINYDGQGSGPVREFMKENAAYWIREFHFDGLRLDAVHGIEDTSREHVVSEICRAARDAAGERTVVVVGECEPQDSRLLKDTGDYCDGLDAIWNEDWHHAAFVALTGRRQAYFTDYRGTAAEFAAMARHGFLYQGQWYSWQKKARGGFSIGLPSSRFVTFLENHDQVANTGLGLRLYHHVDQAQWRTLTALLLLGPGLPLLFQGQEFGSSERFTYFADHDGDLGRSVAEGRAEFLSQFPSLARADMKALFPAPGDRATFVACKLRDEERSRDGALLRLHRDLLHLRRDDEVLQALGSEEVRIESSSPALGVLLLRYMKGPLHRLLVVNFADDHVSPMNDPLLAPAPGSQWVSRWSSEQPQYGGCGATPFSDAGPWVIPSHSATLLISEPRARMAGSLLPGVNA
jgi:maltooligosyltrehalose trehalohydrolase